MKRGGSERGGGRGMSAGAAPENYWGFVLAAGGGADERATTTVKVPSKLRPLAVSTIILPA